MTSAPIVVGVDLSRGACEAVWWAVTVVLESHLAHTRRLAPELPVSARLVETTPVDPR